MLLHLVPEDIVESSLIHDLLQAEILTLRKVCLALLSLEHLGKFVVLVSLNDLYFGFKVFGSIIIVFDHGLRDTYPNVSDFDGILNHFDFELWVECRKRSRSTW